MINILNTMGANAVSSAHVLSTTLSRKKDSALLIIADALEENYEAIVRANTVDLENAVKNGLTTAMQDRLMLNKERIAEIAQATREIAKLPDPINIVTGGSTRPNGLEIIKKTVPIGVVGIIYESRPNVTVDCAILCLKAGNSCILRGGSEAINSNKAITAVLRSALQKADLPPDSVQLVEDTSREFAAQLMRLNKYIDVLIPRGGAGLIKSVVENATIPVIETGAGMCHLYLDALGDLAMALDILHNAKTSRPSVCNAVETLLVHANVAEAFLPMVKEKLENVNFICCEKSLPLMGTDAILASDESWSSEYNDYTLNIKVVADIDEAIDHLSKYSTKHSEIIITDSAKNAEYYLNTVDSATVYHNASSRFTDGGEFGLGAEIGISTQKLHVRGPMGLEALTSYKYIVRGTGQIR